MHFYLFALVLPFLTLFYNFFMVPPRIEALEGGGGKKRRRQEEGGGGGGGHIDRLFDTWPP